MDRVALDLGFIQIYWYSIFIFLGVFFASFIILREAKKQKINEDFIVNLIFYSVIFGFIGARLYYVVFNLDYYLKYPLEILEIWNGGLAIHGGIIFGLLTIIIYCRKYHAKTLKVLDILVVGLILGQAIGRWGNFFNGEAYGAVVTLEYLQKLGLPQFLIDGMYINGAYYTPTFFYESICCVIGFIALLIIRRNKYTKVGDLTAIYLVYYGILRIFIESSRTDALMFMGFKMAQIVSIVMIIVGVVIMIINRKKGKFEDLYNDKNNVDVIRF